MSKKKKKNKRNNVISRKKIKNLKKKNSFSSKKQLNLPRIKNQNYKEKLDHLENLLSEFELVYQNGDLNKAKLQSDSVSKYLNNIEREREEIWNKYKNFKNYDQDIQDKFTDYSVEITQREIDFLPKRINILIEQEDEENLADEIQLWNDIMNESDLSYCDMSDHEVFGEYLDRYSKRQNLKPDTSINLIKAYFLTRECVVSERQTSEQENQKLDIVFNLLINLIKQNPNLGSEISKVLEDYNDRVKDSMSFEESALYTKYLKKYFESLDGQIRLVFLNHLMKNLLSDIEDSHTNYFYTEQEDQKLLDIALNQVIDLLDWYSSIDNLKGKKKLLKLAIQISNLLYAKNKVESIKFNKKTEEIFDDIKDALTPDETNEFLSSLHSNVTE